MTYIFIFICITLVMMIAFFKATGDIEDVKYFVLFLISLCTWLVLGAYITCNIAAIV